MTRTLLALLMTAVTGAAVDARAEEIGTIPSRRGVTEAFVLVRPPAAPVASGS